MVFKKTGTIAAALLVASVYFGNTAYAQEATPNATAQAASDQEFTDQELQSFVAANTAVTELQKASRDTMVAVIEGHSLTLERFNELAKAHRAQKLDEVAENPEEIASFSEAAQEVVKIQPETREKVQQAIEEQGLTKEKYDAMMKAYREDPEVQKQIRKIVAQK
ncbi:DUF4168 domain-containing protein [Pontibacter mangrovi]|uniref:DUF4168 domain-containing protein n=1 Tax=Pontibacter mangrovi TaxID=2589816 RepID=A0A501WFB3_9BACT|nr:DUF4168 domain-containing protein [Pontibacter mangrovi]TPE44216.1 DUF4168 domain-containing protein [Pontibacter mangrovi]